MDFNYRVSDTDGKMMRFVKLGVAYVIQVILCTGA